MDKDKYKQISFHRLDTGLKFLNDKKLIQILDNKNKYWRNFYIFIYEDIIKTEECDHKVDNEYIWLPCKKKKKACAMCFKDITQLVDKEV